MAVLTGYPLGPLYMSLGAYSWTRRVGFEGIVSTPITPRRGIAAGSAFATFELWCLLAPAIQRMANLHPQATICLHVDDLSLTTWSSNREEAYEQIASIAADAVELFTKQKGAPFCIRQGLHYLL